MVNGGRSGFNVFGEIHIVRVTNMVRGKKKIVTNLFHGRIDRLDWDPGKFTWPGEPKPVPFMQYSAKLGREMLRDRIAVHNPVTRKWRGILPGSFRLRWKTMWVKERTNKEARLLWLIWHKAVAVNQWRSQVDNSINITCPVCPKRSEESCYIDSGSAILLNGRGNGSYTS